MVIHRLQLTSFRNYSTFSSEFDPGVNFVYGRNGQGKTNLIESIYIITHLKSFRTSKISQLCQALGKAAAIRSVVFKQGVRHEVEIEILNDHKKVTLNQKNVHYTSDYINNFFSILFAPDLLAAFREYPQVRRNFVDRILFLTDPHHLQSIKDYNRIRRQKNQLLRDGDKKVISSWNRMMAEVIPTIVNARRYLVERINQLLIGIYHMLTGKKISVRFLYRSDFDGKTNIEMESICQYLCDRHEMEYSKGYSIYGVHRDMLWLEKEGESHPMVFSQGEYRIAFIALQLAVNDLIVGQQQWNPVLLLDDIFSELDEGVCNQTLDSIFQRSNQVFISTTAIPDSYANMGQRFHISDGSLA
jgi:DNA replication and repair protein RecF